MPKKPKRKKIGPPRKCIFCDAPASRKGEHLFPKWMHPYLPDSPHKTQGHYSGALGSSKVIHEPSSFRQGAAKTTTVRCVCETCNNEWMSLIESEAKHLLIGMIEQRPLTILVSGLQTLVEWITLKALVAEHLRPNEAVTPPDEIKAFAVSRTIPKKYNVNIGMYAGKSENAMFRVSAHVYYTNESPRGRPRDIQTITFCLGTLLANVISSTTPIIKPGRSPNAKVEMIWPPRRRPRVLKWPYWCAIGPKVVDNLATGFLDALQKQAGPFKPPPDFP